ncbi:MAG TPA: DUF4340 domain-containing protein [Terriglobales bacterium]|nr:DUF4340 domain-containing protein [Terriglobales bacterium]
MKPWLRLLISVVILLGLVGIVYWPHKPATPAAVAPPLIKFSASDVRSVTIAQPGQPTVELTRAGDQWTLSQPYSYPADQSTVSSMLDSLANITGAVDVGSSNNAAAFGLDHASVVKLGLANGQTDEIDFGDDSPTGGNSYLRLGPSGAIKMAPTDVKTNALKSAFLLQDKAILHFPSGQLTALDVTLPGKKPLHLDRANNAWPKDQQSNAQSLLDALNDGQMTAMPDPTGKDAATTEGLAHPAATLMLTWNGGKATLEIGAKKGAAEYYARNSSSPAVFTISDYLLTDITNLAAPPKPLTVGSGIK